MLMRSFGSPLLNHASVSAVTYSLLHNVGLSKTKMPSFSKWGSSEIVTTCLKDSDEITGVGNKMLKDTREKKYQKVFVFTPTFQFTRPAIYKRRKGFLHRK